MQGGSAIIYLSVVGWVKRQDSELRRGGGVEEARPICVGQKQPVPSREDMCPC